MIGIRVTRESALAEVETIERETRAEILGATKYGAVPKRREAFAAWVTAKEQRLATLDCFKALLLPMAPHTVLLEEDLPTPAPTV